MVAYSHVTISTLTTSVALSFFYHDTKWVHIGIAIFTSILPDIDNRMSTLGRILPRLSEYLQKRFGHRGAIHSLYACFLIFLPLLVISYLMPSLGFSYWFVAVWGFTSHLLADSVTITGVKLLYPSNAVYVFPYQSDFRIKTGGNIDYLIGSIFLILSVVYISKTANIGYTGKVREIIGLPIVAMDQFSDYDRKEHLVNGIVFNKLTRERVAISNARLLYADQNHVYIYQNTIQKFSQDKFELKKTKITPLAFDFNFGTNIYQDNNSKIIAVAGYIYTSDAQEIYIDYVSYSQYLELISSLITDVEKNHILKQYEQKIIDNRKIIVSIRPLIVKIKAQKEIDILSKKIVETKKLKEIIKKELIFIYHFSPLIAVK